MALSNVTRMFRFIFKNKKFCNNRLTKIRQINVKRYLLPILALSVFLSISVKAEDTIIKTYIVAGQSNAEGYGLGFGDLFSGTLLPNQNLADLGRSDLATEQTSAYIFRGGNDSGLGEWKNMASGFGNWNGNRFGPELSFSEQFKANTGAPVAIIKYSPGGTSLYTDWDSSLATINRYDYFIDTVNNAKAAAASRGWSLEIGGVLWMQGESDTFGTDAPAAYEQNLGNFIAKVRADLNLPDLGFHIGEIADSTVWPARQQIWDAQASIVATDSNAYLVNGKDLELFTNDGGGSNGIHYSTAGTLLLGERFASSVASTQTVSAYPVSTPDAASTDKNKPLVIDVLANDTGSDLTITEVNSWSKKGGTIKIVDGKAIYTPKQNFIGEDSFWYAFSDYLGRTNSAKVTIDVTNPPIGAYPEGNPDSAITVIGQTIIIDVLANDTGTGLTIDSINPWSLRAGTVVITDNKLSYTPGQNFNGEDKIWYVFEDSQGRTNSAEVTIDVLTNAPYPVAVTEAVEVKRNTATVFDALTNDIGVGLSITEVNAYSVHGGSVTIINGKLNYTPKLNYTGNDSFWYAIKDYSGRTNSIKVTVTISN
jgi:hypothetical protein